RLIVLRQATRAGDAPLLTTEGWAANAELLARLGAHARRIEVVSSAARYDLKQRPSRSNPWQELLAAWRSRGRISAARKGTAMLVVALLAGGGSLRAQDTVCTGKTVGGSSSSSSAVAAPAATSTRPVLHVPPAVPFPVGERLTFGAKYGIFSVGRATTFATVLEPLDDASFLYWIRTLPLEVGKRYEYARYFRPDRNPVILEVVKRERVSVAGKKWRALVVSPKIPQGRGIFAEKS